MASKTQRGSGQTKHTKLQADLDAVNERRTGTAGGVEFNLIHDTVPVEHWLLPSLWQDEPFPGRSEAFPFLWFPWFGELANWKAAKASKPGVDVASLEPECIVERGDKVSLEDVEVIDLPDTTLLDAETDRSIARGWLLVTHANGSKTSIYTPVPIFRRSRVLGGTYLGTEFLHVYERLQAFVAPVGVCKTNPYARNATDLARTMLFDLSSRLKDGDACDALRLMSWGVSLGHLWAKAQQYSNVLPAARMGQKAAARASVAGKAAGVKRRSRRTWFEPAKAIALADFKDHASQASLATHIIEELRIKKVGDVPSDTTVINMLRALQRAGKLPPLSRMHANNVRC